MAVKYTYGGVPFENVLRAARSGSQRTFLEAATPGVDGVDLIDLGSRGEEYSLTGWLFLVDTGPDVDTAVEGLQALDDGTARVLNWRGQNIPDVVMTSFRAFDYKRTDSGTFCRFDATFRRMT